MLTWTWRPRKPSVFWILYTTSLQVKPDFFFCLLSCVGHEVIVLTAHDMLMSFLLHDFRARRGSRVWSTGDNRMEFVGSKTIYLFLDLPIML